MAIATAVEHFVSTVKSELADQFATTGDAKRELFDDIEVQRADVAKLMEVPSTKEPA